MQQKLPWGEDLLQVLVKISLSFDETHADKLGS